MRPDGMFENRRGAGRGCLLLILSVVAVIVVANGCDPARVYEANREIPDHIWKMEEPVRFRVQIEDTVSSHNIYINVRNYSDYPYSNIYLFVHVMSPAGVALTDTVNFLLADKRGRWLGRGIGDLFFIRLPYRQHIRFPYQGVYIFNIEQGMRTDLKGIRDVGLRVERVKTSASGKK